MRVRQVKERGAIAVLAAVVLVVVGGFMALALNVGMIMNTKGQLQNASDSAALAAAASLDGTNAGIDNAPIKAWNYSQAHLVTGEPVEIHPYSDDVILGHWHFLSTECTWGADTPCFEPIPNPGALDPATGGYLRVQAVKVTNGRDGGNHNDPLTTYFGAFLQTERPTNVPSKAVAVGRLAKVACPMPFGVDLCQVVDQDGEYAGKIPCDASGLTPDKTFYFVNDKVDTLGFIDVTGEGKTPNIQYVRDQINDRASCTTRGAIGMANMQNGNALNAVAGALLGLEESPCLLNANREPDPVVDIAVVDMDTGCPGNPKFNQKHNVVAFARARIVEICNNQGNKAICGDYRPPPKKSPPCLHPGPGGASDSITLQFLCDGAPGNSSGSGRDLRLVQ
jgi:hypothetical protein